MTIDIEHQIEYAERLFQTGKREVERSRDFRHPASRVKLRRMEKDLRAIEAIIETLKEVRDRPRGLL